MCRFLFGACCQLQGSVDAAIEAEGAANINDEVQSAAAQYYESYGHQQQNPGLSYNEIKLEEASNKRPSSSSSSNQLGVVINNIYNSGGLENDEIHHFNAVDENLANENYLNSVSHTPEVFIVDHESVSVSSPSPEYGATASTSSTSLPPLSSYFPSSSTQSNRPVSEAEMYLPPSSSVSTLGYQELPTRIPTGPYEIANPSTGIDTENHLQNFAAVSDAIFNSQSTDFTQSGITHPGVDAVIIGEDDSTGYGGGGADSSFTVPSSTERLSTSSTTEHFLSTTTTKTFPIRPFFRPKPDQDVAQAGENFVLVQTINHDSPVSNTPSVVVTSSSSTGSSPAASSSNKPQQSTMSENDIESIESIILMLNDTKTGPQYNSDGGSSTAQPIYEFLSSTSGATYFDSPSRPATIYGSVGTAATAQSTASIDYDKYGPSSYYITTNVPSSSVPIVSSGKPSTSYVFNSADTTRRPIQVHSTISSSYGDVSHHHNNNHISIPSSTLSPPQKVSATKRPILLTSASFATTKPSTQHYQSSTPIEQDDDEVIITTTSLKPTTQKKTKRPNVKISTAKPPSTSYVTGPTTALPKKPNTTQKQTTFSHTTHRPATRPTNKINRKNITDTSVTLHQTPTTQQSYVFEHIVQSKPILQQSQLYATTDHPNPTVHITPKPSVNAVTSSTWTYQPNFVSQYTTPIIKSPSTSFVIHSSPTFSPSGSYDYASSPSYSGSSPSYGGSSYGSSPSYGSTPSHRDPGNEIDDNGYFNGLSSTYRPPPQRTPPAPVAVSSFYSTQQDPSSTPTYPSVLYSTPSFGPEVIEFSTLKDDFYTPQNDLSNFPPVRNPNLNISSGSGSVLDEYDISTPLFVEDEVLNDKMGLLVSKIVESLQGNFEQLVDVVNDDKVPATQMDPIGATSPRPAATTIKRPTAAGTTKKPAVKATTKKPTTSAVARPGTTGTTKRPTGVRAPTTTTTTKKPAATGQQGPKRTTKKPATNTSKRPVTKV